MNVLLGTTNEHYSGIKQRKENCTQAVTWAQDQTEKRGAVRQRRYLSALYHDADKQLNHMENWGIFFLLLNKKCLHTRTHTHFEPFHTPPVLAQSSTWHIKQYIK